jgi:hypothetical protein
MAKKMSRKESVALWNKIQSWKAADILIREGKMKIK